jgi:hypothetical protein
MRRFALVCFALVVAVSCEGPVGPAGPVGPQGLVGPQGPAGQVLVRSALTQADTDGLALGVVSQTKVNGLIVQCWTSDNSSGPWLEIAFAFDDTTPQGTSSCLMQQDGADVDVLAVTDANWWVLFVAIVGGS